MALLSPAGTTARSRMPRKRKRQPEPQPIEPSLTEPVAEIVTPDKEIPQDQATRQQKTWAETVRSWMSHGSTGVHHITTTSPDMVGIRFDKGKERTAEEKREMDGIDLRFYNDAQAWLKTNRHGAFDETKHLAQKFADRRRRAETDLPGH